MTTQFTATDTADLDADIADINGGADSATDTAYTIALSTGISIATQTLSLPTGSSLTLDGPGFLVIESGDGLVVTGPLTLDLPVTGTIELDGGALINDAVTSTGGIQAGGVLDGTVLGITSNDTVDNFGEIETTGELAVHLTNGTVTNETIGTIEGASYGVVFDDAGTLDNAGTIGSSDGVGAYFSTGGTVVNGADGATGASIQGEEDGIIFLGTGMLTNDGSISSSTNDAVYIQTTGTVINGSATDGAALIQTASKEAVEVDGAGTVSNDAMILSTDVSGTGVYLGSGQVNNSVGQTGASIKGGEIGVYVTTGLGTVVNDGTVAATDASGQPSSSGSVIGVLLDEGGSITNGVTSATATTAASISGADFGAAIEGAVGTVDNTGTITGNIAVDLEAGGTVVNGFAAGVGVIDGTLFGVRVLGPGDAAASVTNDGQISGQVGVDFFDGANPSTGTLTDSGTISGTGGTAVRFGDGAERLILEPGFVINGSVVGGTAANDVTTLELGAGTSGAFNAVTGDSGTLTNGFSFSDIQAIAIDAGATWSFTGADAIATLQASGTVIVASSLDVTSALDPTGGGTLQVAASATLEVASAVGAGNTISLGAGAKLVIDTAADFGTGQGTAGYSGDVIAGFVQGDVIDLADVSYASATIQSYTPGTNQLQVGDGTHTADLSFAAGAPGLPGTLVLGNDSNGGTVVESVACYGRGTRILTVRGEVAVENLRVGDLVVTFLDAGATLKPVKWLGHRRVDLRPHFQPANTHPVRFRAGALDERCPHRDLLVSPNHRMRFGDTLVTAIELVNGASVVQDSPAQIEYWHVELDGHDVILAEGVQAETYQDTGNRAAFENGSVVLLHPVLDGDVLQPCLPYAGADAEIRTHLIARAEALGWMRSVDPAPWVEASGQRIMPVREGYCSRFELPPGCSNVRLRSRSGRAWDVDPHSSDRRQLGLKLHGLTLHGRNGTQGVALDSPLLVEGFDRVERDATGWTWRWTNGDAVLALAELAPELEITALEICYDQALPVWIANAVSMSRSTSRHHRD